MTTAIYPGRFDIVGQDGGYCWGADMQSSKIVERLLQILNEEYDGWLSYLVIS